MKLKCLTCGIETGDRNYCEAHQPKPTRRGEYFRMPDIRRDEVVSEEIEGNLDPFSRDKRKDDEGDFG